MPFELTTYEAYDFANRRHIGPSPSEMVEMLRTIGFVRRAVIVSLIQEAVLLSLAASLSASFIALLLVNGYAVRFTMGAFQLEIDSTSILIGCGVGLLLGFFGAIPPAIRALKMPIVDGLRAV